MNPDWKLYQQISIYLWNMNISKSYRIFVEIEIAPARSGIAKFSKSITYHFAHSVRLRQRHATQVAHLKTPKIFFKKKNRKHTATINLLRRSRHVRPFGTRRIFFWEFLIACSSPSTASWPFVGHSASLCLLGLPLKPSVSGEGLASNVPSLKLHFEGSNVWNLSRLSKVSSYLAMTCAVMSKTWWLVLVV